MPWGEPSRPRLRDLARLQAEVERQTELRKEMAIDNADLRRQVAGAARKYDLRRLRDQTVESVNSENQRLRTAMKDAADRLENADRRQVAWIDVLAADLRAALEGEDDHAGG